MEQALERATRLEGKNVQINAENAGLMNTLLAVTRLNNKA